MMALACKFNSTTWSQSGYAWYWTNKTLYFSLGKRYEYRLWGPHLSTYNRTIPAVKKVEYCIFQQRINKGEFFPTKNHDKDSTSSRLEKYILSFPRTGEHMNMKVAHSLEGPGTTHPAIRVTTHNTILNYTHVKTLKFTIIMSLD